MADSVRYSACSFRLDRGLPEEVTRRVLIELERLDLGFFPLTLMRSRTERLKLASASSFSRELVPKKFFITRGAASIPLDAANGVTITFTETEDPSTLPASLVLEFSGREVAANAWNLSAILRLMRTIIEWFQPDYAHVWDNAHRARASYRDVANLVDVRRVPVGLFWINYFGPEWTRNIGPGLGRLANEVAAFEVLPRGGVLVATQEEPYDEARQEHREEQERLERLMGLSDVHGRFPR